MSQQSTVNDVGYMYRWPMKSMFLVASYHDSALPSIASLLPEPSNHALMG